jgi:hypothetical protein
VVCLFWLVLLRILSDGRWFAGSRLHPSLRMVFPVASVEGGHKGSGLGSGTHPTQCPRHSGEGGARVENSFCFCLLTERILEYEA